MNDNFLASVNELCDRFEYGWDHALEEVQTDRELEATERTSDITQGRAIDAIDQKARFKASQLFPERARIFREEFHAAYVEARAYQAAIDNRDLEMLGVEEIDDTLRERVEEDVGDARSALESIDRAPPEKAVDELCRIVSNINASFPRTVAAAGLHVDSTESSLSDESPIVEGLEKLSMGRTAMLFDELTTLKDAILEHRNDDRMMRLQGLQVARMEDRFASMIRQLKFNPEDRGNLSEARQQVVEKFDGEQSRRMERRDRELTDLAIDR